MWGKRNTIDSSELALKHNEAVARVQELEAVVELLKKERRTFDPTLFKVMPVKPSRAILEAILRYTGKCEKAGIPIDASTMYRAVIDSSSPDSAYSTQQSSPSS